MLIGQTFNNFYSKFTQSCADYYGQLPNNIGPTILKSAFYTFAFTAVFSKEGIQDLSRPLTHAGVAALASLIHALVTPLFNYAFGTQSSVWIYETTKSCVTAFLASLTVAYARNGKINVLAMELFYLISFNSLKAFFHDYKNGPIPFFKDNSVYFCWA